MRNWIIASVAAIGIAGVTFFTLTGVNDNKDFVSFSINNAEAVIHQSTGEMDVVLPSGTNLTHLAPEFVATGPSVTVIGIPQYTKSATYPGTFQNFTSNVPYVVHASDGSTKSYFAHVTTSSNDADAYFDIFALDNGVNHSLSYGQIDSNNINVIVPYSTDLSGLVSYFKYIGKSVKVGAVKQISNITANNFSSAVTYNVYANDGSSNTFTINVTKSSGNSKVINAFSIITNNGTFPCQISGLTITCGIPSNIPLNNLIAQWSSTGSQVKIGSVVQYSGLTSNNFTSPVIYNVVSGDGLTNQNYTINVSNSNYIFLNVENLAQNIFDNTTYLVQFNIINNTSSTINDIADHLDIPQPFTWSLISDGCNGTDLLATESCAVTGNLSVSKSYAETAIKFYANNGSGQPIVNFDKIITAIPQLDELQTGLGPESYAAYTFVNNGSHRLFATVEVNANNIEFNANNIGHFTNETESYGSFAVELVKGHNTLYIPAYPGVGGKILISVDNKLPDGPTPSVTATNPADTYYTRWQQVEYGGGLTGGSVAALFNLNPTNVDFFSLPTSISTVISGVVGAWSDNSFATQGIVYAENIKTDNIYNIIESGLANVPNSDDPSWNGLTQFDQSGTHVLRVLSPSSIFPFMSSPGSQFYFNGDFYNQYIDDLWEYYTDNLGGHFLYVDDSPVASLVTPGSTCILKCQVTNADNLMHCVFESGVCPVNSSTGTLDGEYDVGGEISPAGMTKFTPVDFVSAAGTNTATTFGINGTYRSVTGENIVAAQSIGFLPYCSDTNFIFGTNEFITQFPKYYTPQYTCLTNYNDYTASVIDQYSLQTGLYMGYYNYGYSDTIGQSGAIYSANNLLYPFTIEVNYQ